MLFCTLHLSPAITFGPDFTFNDSINDFLPCAPHFISFTNRNNKSAFVVVNGLILILSGPTLTSRCETQMVNILTDHIYSG